MIGGHQVILISTYVYLIFLCLKFCTGPPALAVWGPNVRINFVAVFDESYLCQTPMPALLQLGIPN